jgi:hypothetical protein
MKQGGILLSEVRGLDRSTMLNCGHRRRQETGVTQGGEARKELFLWCPPHIAHLPIVRQKVESYLQFYLTTACTFKAKQNGHRKRTVAVDSCW